MMTQVLSPPSQLDVQKCIPDYLPRQKPSSPFFPDLGSLVPVTGSPIHSDSPADTVDDDQPSPHSPSLSSGGNYHYATRPSANFDSPSSTSPATDMFDANTRPTLVPAQYPPPSSQSNNSSDSTLRDSGAVSSYLSESPSPVDVHRPSSSGFPHPISAPHSQNRFSLTGAPSYPGDDRSIVNSLADRYPRPSAQDKYSDSYAQSNTFLDQRRMSEPAIIGNANAYPPTDPNSCNRLSQYPFAFNPPSQPSRPYISTLQRGTSLGSLRDLRSSDYHSSQASGWKNDGDLYDSHGLYEPISPLNPNFSHGLLNSPSNAVPYSPVSENPYGPSPPNTGTSTSSAPALGSLTFSTISPPSQAHHMQRGANPSNSFSDNTSSKTYSFVALPGNSVKKRPRRRYDEIERLYQCSWPDCTKSYGTLNHLNAHVTMQKHGPKRSPSEFKELRKQWRKAKKEAEAVANAAAGGSSRGLTTMPSRSEDSGSHDVRYGAAPPHQTSGMGLSVNASQVGYADRYALSIEDIRYPHEREDDNLHYTTLRRFNNVGTPASWHAGGNLVPRTGLHQPYISSSLPSQPTHLSPPSPRMVARLGPDSTLLTPLSSYQNHPSHPPLLPSLHSAGDMTYPENYDLYESDSRPGTGHASLGGQVSGDDYDRRG